MNLRPSGYEPDELPGCSTPRSGDRSQEPGTRGSRVVADGSGADEGFWDSGDRSQGSGARMDGAVAPVFLSWFLGPGACPLSACCEGRAATYSPASWDAVPSARRGFTVEFGMGSGVAPSPWPPGRRGRIQVTGARFQEPGRRTALSRRSFFVLVPGSWLLVCVGGWGSGWESCSSAIERLGPVSCTRCRASTSGLSTCWSGTALGRDLVLRGVSRLDAFSGYLVRT